MIADRFQDTYADSRNSQSASAPLLAFLLGAAVGAGVALLYAPTTGSESRTKLREGAQRLRAGAEDKLGDARHALEDRASAVRDVMESGKEVVRESVNAGRETIHRLRETAATGAASGTPSTTRTP